ncbi:hypothetical protein ACO0LC_28860 [Undibacterium sp. JH2W]|uniref:hypothetical protein n=1 Tax=Undibacterium sp. JH2W TaxID=3413037 RepID=UPI003BF38B13
MPSKTTPEQLLSPLSKNEIQLIQAYRIMETGYHLSMLNMMKELARKYPANASSDIKANTIKETPIPTLANLRAIGFDIECNQIDLEVFIESILEKVDDFRVLDEHNKRALNAICCFSGYAAQKAKEARENNELMLENIGNAMEGDCHV